MKPRLTPRISVARLRKPAAAADHGTDARIQVWFAPGELHPWHVRVDFLVYEGGEHVYCGCALERPVTVGEAEQTPEQFELTDAQADLFARNLPHWRRIAEHWLRYERDEAGRVRLAMLGQDRDMLARIISDAWEAGATSLELERRYWGSRSTIYRRRLRAKQNGHLPGRG